MKRVLSLVGNLIFGVVVLAIAGTILALTVLPPVLHYQTYVVLSGSMEPTIHTGSIVVATATSPDSLHVGDIITFIRPGDQENVTHRIVAITGTAQGRSFVTKGDANGAPDQGEIRYDRLAGQVRLTIPFLGYFFKFVGSPAMRFLFIVVPGLLLLGTWLWEVWRPDPNLKKPDRELPAGMAPPPTSPAALKDQQNIEFGVAADAAALPLRQ